jgi:hypothetical protein
MTCCPQLDPIEYTREAQSLREWCDERGIVTANGDQWAEWRRWFDSRERASLLTINEREACQTT